MKKKYFIAICLILFFISMANAFAEDINTTDTDTDVITVSNNDVLGNSVKSGTFIELQEKINNASEGSTIELTNNYTYEDTFNAEGIIIDKSLTIEGNGFTIDGANQARIFFINATNNIVLNNIIFENANSLQGGAILFDKAITNVSITNSIFTNNSLSDNGHSGGAINFNDDASGVLFENNTFENNYAPLGYGGNIAFDKNANKISIKGCNFRVTKPRENIMIAGGGIYFIGNATSVIIDNCEFDNFTVRTGGGIYIEKDFAISGITNTKFTNNKAYTENKKYGGGALTIEGEADLTFITNCEFINNTATTHGGAIKLMGYTRGLVINNTIFDANYAPYAGALCLQGIEELSIIDSKFTNNKGTASDIVGGGGIYVIGNLTQSIILGCEFENNSARTGGGIYVEKELINTQFINNKFINNTAFTNNTKYGGGAIAVERNASNNIFNGTSFTLNSAKTHGGAIKFMDYDKNNAFIDCTFIDNYSPYGGSIAVSNKSEDLNLINDIFTTNEENMEAPIEIIGGGAIYFISDANELNITDCDFSTLTARAGGAIYVEGNLNNATINKTNFINNHATSNNTKYGGGAIDIQGNVKNLVITESNFENNNARTFGGAIRLKGNSTDISIVKSTFDGNNAESAGGIAFENATEVIISESKFTNNKVNGVDGEGGAIRFEGDTLTITNSKFTGNTATEDACDSGAIFFEANNLNINQSEFINNSAYSEGAIYAIGENVTITKSKFENNNAERGIIGIYAYNSLIDECKFINNSAENYVGVANLKGTMTINNSYFANNTAGESTRVIRNSLGYEAKITNCVFENNVGNEGNYTIDNNYGTIYLHNNTINTQSAEIRNYGGDILSPCTAIAIENKTIPVAVGQKTTLTAVIVDDNGNLIEEAYYVYFKINNETIESTYNPETSKYEAQYTFNTTGSVTVDIACPSINITVKKGTYDVGEIAINAKNAAYVINYGGTYKVSFKYVTDGTKVTFTLNGKDIGTATVKNGVASIKLTAKILKTAKAGKKNMVIKIVNNFTTTSKTVKITINKEKTKITAKAKTFKRTTKTKKYTITLKNSKNKAMKKAKVTLKVKGKTYTAKTNSKGKATFKITKLTKKGTFKAVIKYNGSSYYNKVTKNVKIKVQ